MDNRLFGKTILIGREPVNGRLLVSMKHNGKNYFAPIGQPGSVSGGVSRCIPSEDKAHCRLQIDMKGDMTLENAKAENVTFVDGTQIMKKHIDEGSIIEMGQYKYQVSVAEVLKTLTLIANQVIGGGSAVKSGGGASENVPTFSIDHLKAVYDEFHDKQMEIKYRQRNLNLLRGVAPIFTISSGAVSRISGVNPMVTDATTVLFFVGLAVTIYAFYMAYSDKSIDELDKLTEEFQHKYVCPNPQCRHFLGMKPYSLLKQDNGCVYCKCRFEK